MIPVSSILDDLERQLGVLDAQLPAERSVDESDAISAMHSCVHELRRLMNEFPTVHMRYIETQDTLDHEQAHLELRRLIHDVRTPAGVLYTYLRLVTGGVLFAKSGAEQRNEAAALVDLVRELRDQVKIEGL